MDNEDRHLQVLREERYLQALRSLAWSEYRYPITDTGGRRTRFARAAVVYEQELKKLRTQIAELDEQVRCLQATGGESDGTGL
jgi:hypothetical protein